MIFYVGEKPLDLSFPRVMGVLNMTPDSFSDGGLHFSGSNPSVDLALRSVERMLNEGAAVIDIGGESTRPGAIEVSVQQEVERVVPIIDAISKRFDTIISVDTSTPAVMIEAAKFGAALINDVRALTKPGALEAAAETGLSVCLMHMQGQPTTMQKQPSYKNVIEEVINYLEDRIIDCQRHNIEKQKIIVDPGFGFGKNLNHNLLLLRNLNSLSRIGCPVMVGLSRKSMLKEITGKDVDNRLAGSLALAAFAAVNGASFIRVHDVKETVDVLRVYSAIFGMDCLSSSF